MWTDTLIQQTLVKSGFGEATNFAVFKDHTFGDHYRSLFFGRFITRNRITGKVLGCCLTYNSKEVSGKLAKTGWRDLECFPLSACDKSQNGLNLLTTNL